MGELAGVARPHKGAQVFLEALEAVVEAVTAVLEVLEPRDRVIAEAEGQVTALLSTPGAGAEVLVLLALTEEATEVLEVTGLLGLMVVLMQAAAAVAKSTQEVMALGGRVEAEALLRTKQGWPTQVVEV